MAPSKQDQEAEPQSQLIKSLNSLRLDIFKARQVDPALRLFPIDGDVAFSFHFTKDIPDALLKSCLELIALTSSAAYKKSSIGWSPSDKLKEMGQPDMKYLILSHPEKPLEAAGFLSFMLCCEDDIDVIYCYEVHLQPEMRGRQLGYQLMRIMEQVGRAAGVEKAMLTVFTANEAALKFYNRLGYEWYDEEPLPPTKRLRGRTTPKPKPSYVILALDLR